MSCPHNEMAQTLGIEANSASIAALTSLTQRLGQRQDAVEAKMGDLVGDAQGNIEEIIREGVEARMGAAMSEETAARENADAALRSSIDDITSVMATKAELAAEAQARMDRDSVLSGSVATVDAKVERLVGEENMARTAADNSLTARCDSMASDISALSTAFSNLEQEIGSMSLAETIAQFREGIAANATEIEAVKTRLAAAESDIDALETTTASQGNDIASLNRRVTAAENEIPQIATNAAAIARLEEAVSADETAAQGLTARVASLETSVATLNSQVAAMDSTVRSYCEGVAQRITQLENAIRMLIAGNTSLANAALCPCAAIANGDNSNG